MEIRIPYCVTNGLPLVQVQAAGKAGWMVLDTGGMQTSLHCRHFPGFTGKGRIVTGFNGSMVSTAAAEDTLDVLQAGDAVFENLPVLYRNFNRIEQDIAPAMPEGDFLGTLALDALRPHRVLLDPGRCVITLDPVKGLENVLEVPLAADALPIVPVSMQGREYPFVLDSGSNLCLVDKVLQKDVPAEPAQSPNLYSLQVSLAGKIYKDLPAMFTDLSPLRPQVEAYGILGFQVLSAQKTLMDFPAGKLVLCPDPPADASG